MKNVFKAFWIIALFFSLTSAQNFDPARIENNFSRLERKIENSLSLAAQYNVPRAVEQLQNAQKELNTAQDLYRQWQNSGRKSRTLLVQAYNHYKIAAKIVDTVSRLILLKPTARLKSELDRLIQELETLLARQPGNLEARYFAQKGRAFLQKAALNFSGNRYLKGNENLRIARYFVNKALNLLKGNGGDDQKDFNNWYNNLKLLKNRVATRINGKSLETEVLKNAEKYIRTAEANYRNGDLRGAINQLKMAERLIYRLIDMTENGKDDSAKVKNNLTSLERYLQTVDQAVPRDDQTARRLLKKANHYMTAARNDFNNGRLKQAAQNINLAQRLALKAYKKGPKESAGQNSDKVREQAENIGRLLEMQNQRLNAQQGQQAARALHEQARTLYEQSRLSLEQGEPQAARFGLTLTLRLLNRAERLMAKEEASAPVTNEAFNREYDRLRQIVDRLTNNKEWQHGHDQQVHTLASMLDKARELASEDRLRAAMEILQVVQNQIRQLLNL